MSNSTLPTSPSGPSSSSSSTLPSNDAHKAKFQVETTGNYWQDVREAVHRISPRDDIQRLGEIPCARSSLLSGIASGAGIGAVRALTTSPFVACNWAVGTFMVVSLGTWTICQNNRVRELTAISKVVETAPRRFVRRKEGEETSAEASSPSQQLL